jgi:hypothetical protein
MVRRVIGDSTAAGAHWVDSSPRSCPKLLIFLIFV